MLLLLLSLLLLLLLLLLFCLFVCLFGKKYALTLYANCPLKKQFALNVKDHFLGKIKQKPRYCLLNFIPSKLRTNLASTLFYHGVCCSLYILLNNNFLNGNKEPGQIVRFHRQFWVFDARVCSDDSFFA